MSKFRQPFDKRITTNEELDRVQFAIEKAFQAVTDRINSASASSEPSDTHDLLTNFSTTSQSPAATTRTYINGSRIAIGSSRKLQIGTMFHWGFNMQKTNAGIAPSTIDIAVGSSGTTADTARVSFTKPGGTAAVDEAWVDVYATVRGPIGTNGTIIGQFIMSHNGNNVGHAVIPVVVVNQLSAAFDLSASSLSVGLCITTGAADVITIQFVQATATDL